MMTRPSGSHRDQVVQAAIALANELGPGYSGGYPYLPADDPADRVSVAERVFSAFHDSSVAFAPEEGAHIARLAASLHEVFLLFAEREVAAAVPIINGLLREFPASPHVSTEPPYSLHYHDGSLAAAPGWQIGCASALGSFVSSGAWQYIGVCQAERCDRVFLDDTRNRSKRFCSTRCQNREKVRTFRLRAASGRAARDDVTV
jgi:predicted RNA-binding Zn ribbon-like protein